MTANQGRVLETTSPQLMFTFAPAEPLSALETIVWIRLHLCFDYPNITSVVDQSSLALDAWMTVTLLVLYSFIRWLKTNLFFEGKICRMNNSYFEVLINAHLMSLVQSCCCSPLSLQQTIPHCSRNRLQLLPNSVFQHCNCAHLQHVLYECQVQ